MPRPMADPARETPAPQDIPLGQRLFDNLHLLLALGLAVMVVLYTGWGMWEALTLPKATLP